LAHHSCCVIATVFGGSKAMFFADFRQAAPPGKLQV
jgi:hypothetical protein